MRLHQEKAMSKQSLFSSQVSNAGYRNKLSTVHIKTPPVVPHTTRHYRKIEYITSLSLRLPASPLDIVVQDERFVSQTARQTQQTLLGPDHNHAGLLHPKRTAEHHF
jgi:hypothetical protein